MNQDDIRKQVRLFILREFLPGESPEDLTDSLPLLSSKVLDSLATLKLVAYLEETFGFEFAAHEIGVTNLDSLDRIAAYVASKRR
jgi:acyl carrier protein